MSVTFRLALLLTATAMVGCSQEIGTAEVLTTVPVAGTLTFQGQPLESYRISFFPDHGDRASSGVTDAAGHFVIGTNKEGDGAPVGKYRVIVAFSPPATTETDGMPIDDPSKLPKPKIKIPAKYSNPEQSGLTQEVPKGGLTDLKIELK